VQGLSRLHKKISDEIIAPFLQSQPFSEISIVDALDKLLPNNAPFFIGNSMPIRLADMFMNKSQSKVYTNRGASGIDGLLATAVGIAKQYQKAITLLIGDTAFLYDLNSLSLLKQLATPFVIVLINNDGGSIFNMLPVPTDQRRTFYQLPHGLEFNAVCQQFSVVYHQPKTIDDFKLNYSDAINSNKSTLIEICVENGQTFTQLNSLKAVICNE
jgi:2-succinyl-5-enolpyruvyl-6-hydroxy-3-cyclohexene-1-carboxylate synthase